MNLPPSKQLIYLIFSPLIIFPYPFPLIPLGTSEYPHKSTLSKSINLKCDVNEYELDYGRCKNGGFPDPLNDCKCRCPDGYGGDDCTEYEYNNCRVIKLTAKVKKQYISADFGRGKCFFAMKLEKADDKIQAKRITIKIEKLEGFDCRYPWSNNYIEIKYRKDKSAFHFLLLTTPLFTSWLVGISHTQADLPASYLRLCLLLYF
uniref:EGF-like domain-containing protein n=1 Tax=Meloidogyne incognita TaxID=6306 RepID=A0A914MLX8_MELIC